SKVDIPLSAVVDFIVDEVEQSPANRSFPLVENLIDLLQTLFRYVRPQRINLLSRPVPHAQKLFLGSRRRIRFFNLLKRRPLPGNDALNARSSDVYQLHDEQTERAHASY